MAVNHLDVGSNPTRSGVYVYEIEFNYRVCFKLESVV